MKQMSNIPNKPTVENYKHKRGRDRTESKVIKKLFSPTFGKVVFQKSYEHLLQVSLSGMNIGVGEVEESGETYILRYLKDKLASTTEHMTIFDVGANIGRYTLLVLDVFRGRNVNVFSFEPSLRTFQELRKNVGENRKAKLYNFGFSNENARVTLFYDTEKSGLSSLYNRKLDHIGIQMKHKEEVEVKRIDDFCEENKTDKIDLLKMDVEGHELKALEGANNMIDKDAIRLIQFEFGGCNIDSRTFFRDFFYFLNGKYRIFRILKDGLYPINRYKETCELFIATNFLAEHR